MFNGSGDPCMSSAVINNGNHDDQSVTSPELGQLLNSFPHTKQVGAYLIGRTIGEGSFAKVKEGLHVLTGEKVAIKVIDKRKARADRYVRRNMRREARLLQRVRHSHVVQLLDVMETENGFYLVMEHCGGGDLMTRICDSEKIDEADARHYVRQIVSAVDYLHRAGILHRDLKVENLLLDENGKIKIIDFGLSNVVRRGGVVDAAHSRSLPDTDSVTAANDAPRGTTTTTWYPSSGPSLSDPDTGRGGLPDELCTTQCGSPAYAAPELLSGAKYGPKVDVWSIGVNMFAMLTGNLPFTVEPFSVRALLVKMMHGQMNELPRHLTKNCQDLLKQFLTANPDRRISLYRAMHHPWLADGRNKPMEPAPFPNRLTESALNRPVLDFMVNRLAYRHSDVVRLVTGNVPSGATATYHLLLKRMHAAFRHKVPTSDAMPSIVGTLSRHATLRRRSSDITDRCSAMLRNDDVIKDVGERHGDFLRQVVDSVASPRLPDFISINAHHQSATDDTQISDVTNNCSLLSTTNNAAIDDNTTKRDLWRQNDQQLDDVTISREMSDFDRMLTADLFTFDLLPSKHATTRTTAASIDIPLATSDETGYDVIGPVNWPTNGFAVADSDITGRPAAAVKHTDVERTLPHRYVISLGCQPPPLPGNGVISDADDEDSRRRREAVLSLAGGISPRRLLGRRQLLQQQPGRINFRPSFDPMTQRVAVHRHPPLPSQSASVDRPRPSALSVIELRFSTNGVNGYHQQPQQLVSMLGGPRQPAVEPARCATTRPVIAVPTTASLDCSVNAPGDESMLPQLLQQGAAVNHRER